MTDELFTTEPTAPTPLHQARARLLRSQQSVDRLELIYDSAGQIHPALKDAKSELKSAENSVAVEENRELERLRASREPA